MQGREITSLADGKEEGVNPGGGVIGIETQRIRTQLRDRAKIATGEQGPVPRLGGNRSHRGMIVEQADVGAIRQGGLADLPELGEQQAGGVIVRIKLVGEGQGQDGLVDPLLVVGDAGLFEEVLAADGAQRRPGRGPREGPGRDLVADAAEHGKGEDHREEVGGEDRAAVEEKRPAPEWAHIFGVDGAAQGPVRGRLEQRADAAEATLAVPVERGFTTGFPGKSRVRRVLAWATVLTASSAVQRLAQVPVNQPPRRTKEVGEPSHSGGQDWVGGADRQRESLWPHGFENLRRNAGMFRGFEDSYRRTPLFSS